MVVGSVPFPLFSRDECGAFDRWALVGFLTFAGIIPLRYLRVKKKVALASPIEKRRREYDHFGKALSNDPMGHAPGKGGGQRGWHLYFP